MPEVIAALLGAEVLEAFAEEWPQRRDGPTARPANDGFQLRKGQFDRIEVRAVGREEDQRGSCRCYRALDRSAFVCGEIIGDDDIARVQCWHEDLFDIREKDRPINRAVEHTGGREPREAQRGDEGACLPPRKRRVVVHADTARSPAVPTEQIGGDARFVEEHQVFGVPLGRALAPGGPGYDQVRSVVFTGPNRFT